MHTQYLSVHLILIFIMLRKHSSRYSLLRNFFFNEEIIFSSLIYKTLTLTNFLVFLKLILLDHKYLPVYILTEWSCWCFISVLFQERLVYTFIFALSFLRQVQRERYGGKMSTQNGEATEGSRWESHLERKMYRGEKNPSYLKRMPHFLVSLSSFKRVF